MHISNPQLYAYSIGILIPTYNAGTPGQVLLEQIKIQPLPIFRKIILDSGSIDHTVQFAQQNNFEIIRINKSDFTHGSARQKLADAAPDCDILIYLTQDSILFDENSIRNLLAAFEDPTVGIAYGRQLPRIGAKTIEAHARLFNYPTRSMVKSIADKDKLGIKTAFCSNSFAAYRRTTLEAIGGFPVDVIFAEDVYVAAKMLLHGWKVAYVANAKVFHSHNYSIMDELRRSFDIGVFHQQNQWLLEELGSANNEGFKFVRSEFLYVCRHSILLFPKMIFSIAAKFIGYRLGRSYLRLSLKKRKFFSMNKGYWDKFAEI